ncbi:hypothetical protein PVK06_021784 [Gossypium arboreum]|uniref:ATP-dependent DNA ligase family profile domain-containing protein n=1 Tax=Gossypium arboreum TaxID=29729 RepID=A0ABR0PRH7_GOSAR|nr:hypothetical protein PVK06_021784 [Gossypium arboreum]
MSIGSNEVKHIIRLLTPKTSNWIRFSVSSLLVALGQASVYNKNRNLEPLDSPEAAEIVKQVHSVCLVYDKLIWAILNDGISKLSSSCSFSIEVSVEPMLVKPSLAESEIIERFNGTAYDCDYKYDGERALIHYMEDGKVEIYTRNLEPVPQCFPTLLSPYQDRRNPG